MPCCLVHKADAKVRKPAWQLGTDADTKEKRDIFALQAKHEKAFADSFLMVIRELVDSKMKRIIRAALKKPTKAAALRAIPFFRAGSEETFGIWMDHSKKLALAYSDVIEDIASRERKKHGWKSKVETFKADVKVNVPTIPINPTSVDWIRNRSLERVVGLSNDEQGRVRAILAENFEEGGRLEDIVDEIASTVGLTDTQWARLNDKLAIAEEAGASDSFLTSLHDREVKRIQLQRAKAIARTEITEAHTQGLLDTWRTAEEENELEEGAEKEWVSFEDSRTSQVCMDLDGQTVPINEQFTWTKTGQTFDGPPSHPNCRSTLVLNFPDDTE